VATADALKRTLDLTAREEWLRDVSQDLWKVYADADEEIRRILSEGNITEWRHAYLVQQRAQVRRQLILMRNASRGWAERNVPLIYGEGLADVDGWLMQKFHAARYRELRRSGLSHLQTTERIYRETGMGVGGLSKAAHPGKITPMDLGFTAMHNEAIERIQRSVVERLDYASGGVARNTDDIFRLAQLRSVREAYAMGETQRQLSKRLTNQLATVYGPKIRTEIEALEAQGLKPAAILKRLEKSGLVSERMRDGLRIYLGENGKGGTAGDLINHLRRNAGTEFVDKSGRRWDMKRYTEMVSRTTAREASETARWGRCVDCGIDTVRVNGTSKWPESPCIQFQGDVLSLSGKTAGLVSMSDALSAGLFHPNCVHSTSPYIEDKKAYVAGFRERWRSRGTVTEAKDMFADLGEKRREAADAGMGGGS